MAIDDKLAQAKAQVATATNGRRHPRRAAGLEDTEVYYEQPTMLRRKGD